MGWGEKEIKKRRKKGRKRWGGEFDRWEENMHVRNKKKEQKMIVRTRESKHEPTKKKKT